MVNLAMDPARRDEVRRRFADLRALEDATYGADWVNWSMAGNAADDNVL